jgi:monovalent cation:H+ antiporter, CPA1 family
MNYHSIFASLILITALAAFFNERFFKLPKTIALTIISLSISIVVTQLVRLKPDLIKPIYALLTSFDFKTTVLDIMLGYLLFASALHINSITLKRHFYSIFYLASLGVITSTLFTGLLLWYISQLVHFPLTLPDCLIFGALISPTDPIAVGSILKNNKLVPKDTKTKITGESLFNDAAGILLLFILIKLFYSNESHSLTMGSLSLVIIAESIGGIVWGAIVGYVTALFLARTKDNEITILLTLAAASCGYIVANKLHFSGVITMVIAGLVIGNLSRKEKFSQATTQSMNWFWGLFDNMLNAVLFVIIGLEMLVMDVNSSTIVMGVIGIFIVFIARFASMLIPNLIYAARKYKTKPKINWSEIILLCWGGIRGGISIALALATPNIPHSLIAITYVLVIFSILIQGSSFSWIISKIYGRKSS